MPSEFNPRVCTTCFYDGHLCTGCGCTLTHEECNGTTKGICDDCQPLMQARP